MGPQPHTILIAAAIALSACTSSSRTGERLGLPSTGSPALHAVNDARLRELMDRMNSLMFERFIAEPDIDRERRHYALKIADTVAKLGATADDILSRLPALGLTPDEQTAFRALADKLRDQADALNNQAKFNRIDAIEPMLEQLTMTCSSCHSLFRKFGRQEK